MTARASDPIAKETDCAICREPVEQDRPHFEFALRLPGFRVRLGCMHHECVPHDVKAWADAQIAVVR